MRFILAPLLAVVGFLLMKYNVQVTEITGRIDFAERYLRGGFAGTYTWWRLVGLFLIIIAVLWFFGYLSLFSSSVNLGPQ